MESERSGFRQAPARPRPTKQERAIEVTQLLDERSAGRAMATLVRDGLGTHSSGAIDEAFEPELARAFVQRIDFCDTMMHGSWLKSEITAWSEKTSAKQPGVNCQLRIEHACMQLRRGFPKIKT
jgi:hypothetical protein